MKGFFRAVADSLRGVFADPRAKSTMVVALLLYGFLYPQPYVGEVVRDVPIAVVDQDGSGLSREFLRRVEANESTSIAAVVPDLPAAQDMFFSRRAYGILLIPAGFEETLLDGRPSAVAAYGDGSYFLLYSAAMTSIGGAARSLGAEVQGARLIAGGVDAGTATALVAPLTVASVAVFNPQGGYASYVVPAAFVLILQQTLLMGIGILHAGRPFARGVRILAAPVAYMMLYCVWVVFAQVLLPLIYAIPRLGSLGTLFAIALPFLTATTAMGFAIARAIPWREGVVFFLVVLGMPMFFLSGISWPVETIPPVLHRLSLLVPSTSAMSAFVRADQMGASLGQIAPAIGTLWALTAGYTALALIIDRALRRPDKAP